MAEADFKNWLSELKTKCDIVTYYYNLKAPLTENSVVGKVYLIDENGVVLDESELIVKQEVPRASFLDYIRKLVTNW